MASFAVHERQHPLNTSLRVQQNLIIPWFREPISRSSIAIPTSRPSDSPLKSSKLILDCELTVRHKYDLSVIFNLHNPICHNHLLSLKEWLNMYRTLKIRITWFGSSRNHLPSLKESLNIYRTLKIRIAWLGSFRNHLPPWSLPTRPHLIHLIHAHIPSLPIPSRCNSLLHQQRIYNYRNLKQEDGNVPMIIR